ncbi:MAG TPA: hypothetical protein VGI40_03955 [Pirellulaceae bacterium]|jgi:hypothetical protein
MPQPSRWWLDHTRWVEAFVLVNISFLALDIYLAHSVNVFRVPAEYVPLYFSIAAPFVLLIGLIADFIRPRGSVWRDLGFLVGWLAIAIGLAGVIFHLDSRFFYERTLKSLVYAAPFAAPLAYTGLGLLLLMNRMVDAGSRDWPLWVLLLALGGFFGNFLFSLTDHAQNAFYHWTEWIPVVSSAFAVGFLCVPFLTPITQRYLWVTSGLLLLQAAVGVLGFVLHMSANLHGPAPWLWENIIFGAPPLAPLLFPNLVLLAFIGIYVLAAFLPETMCDRAVPESS